MVALPADLLPGDRSAFMVELRRAGHDVVSECRGLWRFASETVPLQQTIQGRAIDARQSRCTRHVAGSARDQAGDVLLLEVRQHVLFGEVVRVVQNSRMRTLP